MALGTAATVAIAAVVAGTVGAGTVVLLGAPSAPPAPAAPPPDANAALLAQLDRQEKEIAALRARIEEASAAHPVVNHENTFLEVAPDNEIQFFDPATLKSIDGASAPPATDLAAVSPEERAKYEAVYKEMRAKEQEEARKTRQAAYENGLRARLDRLPASLGLTPEQKDAALKILIARGEKMRALFAESRAAGDAESIRAAREKADAIRAESRDALALTLNADQVKAVEDAAGGGGPSNRNRLEGGRRGQRIGGGGGGDGNPPR